MAKTAKKNRLPARLTKAVKPAKPKSVKKPTKTPKKSIPPVTRRIADMSMTGSASPLVLDRLWDVVMSRRDADPAVSHSARLLSRGTAKVAQKFGEEAVECLIEAVAGNPEALIGESADVLYHLLVLWVAAGIEPHKVWNELERREGVSGVAEKASRVRDLPLAFGVKTRKIP